MGWNDVFNAFELGIKLSLILYRLMPQARNYAGSRDSTRQNPIEEKYISFGLVRLLLKIRCDSEAYVAVI